MGHTESPPWETTEIWNEFIDVRMQMDLALAELLARKLAGDPNHELRDLVAQMREIGDQGLLFAEQDRAFHTALFQHTGNSLLVQLVGAFWDVHTAVIPQLGIPMPEDIHKTIHAHGDMVDALEAGDVDAYREAVIRHYVPLQKVLDDAR